MKIWQVDFYRRPLKDDQGHDLWELLICTPDQNFICIILCPQPEANARWLVAQFQEAAQRPEQLPELVQVFRPQTLPLVQAACQELGIPVQATRRTPTLKQLLQERVADYPAISGYTGQPYDPIWLEQPPPQPMPEKLWGERWQFAALPAREVTEVLLQRPIPILEAPEFLLPAQLHLSPQQAVPGVVIYGGRQAMSLARWLQQQQPVALQAIQGEPSGLILAAGLSDRWILVTYNDPEVLRAAQDFERRKQASQGLHFLLIQPDDTGITDTGLWLLQAVD